MISRADLSVVVGELRAVARELPGMAIQYRHRFASAAQITRLADRIAVRLAPADTLTESIEQVAGREAEPGAALTPLIPRDDLKMAGEVLCIYANYLREHNPRADALTALSGQLCHVTTRGEDLN